MWVGLNHIQWCVESGVNKGFVNSRWRHPSTSLFFLLEILLSWNNLIIWNNYVEIHRKHMQVRIIIFRRTLCYNSLGNPIRQHEVEGKILLYYVNGGGGQIFVKSFDGLVCVYKNTVIECQVQVWTVWMLILFLMPLNCRVGHFLFIQNLICFVTIYTYKLLQAFPPKASVENSSAQWAILFNNRE